jgi:flagellar biosynthetic protein FliO
MLNPSELLKKWLKTSTPRQKLTAALLAFSLLATCLLFALPGTSESPTDPLGSTPLYFVGVFIKLIGVLLLIVASAAIFRRWKNLGPKGGSVRQLHLLETVRLSPRQALHLVAIGDQHILIGATDQSIALITPVEASLSFPTEEASQSQSVPVFSSLLQAFNSQLPTELSKEKE